MVTFMCESRISTIASAPASYSKLQKSRSREYKGKENAGVSGPFGVAAAAAGDTTPGPSVGTIVIILPCGGASPERLMSGREIFSYESCSGVPVTKSKANAPLMHRDIISVNRVELRANQTTQKHRGSKWLLGAVEFQRNSTIPIWLVEYLAMTISPDAEHGFLPISTACRAPGPGTTVDQARAAQRRGRSGPAADIKEDTERCPGLRYVSGLESQGNTS